MATKGFTHEKSFRGDTDTWLTPLSLVESLGKFDLDPCGYPGHKTASRLICSPEDGLSAQWNYDERVWLNSPYGPATGVWLDKLAEHGNGIALVFARTDTRWFQSAAEKADGFLFLAGRIRFLKPDMEAGDQAAAPSVLVAFGAHNARVLETCGLRGAFLKR